MDASALFIILSIARGTYELILNGYYFTFAFIDTKCLLTLATYFYIIVMLTATIAFEFNIYFVVVHDI